MKPDRKKVDPKNVLKVPRKKVDLNDLPKVPRRAFDDLLKKAATGPMIYEIPKDGNGPAREVQQEEIDAMREGDDQ